VKSALERFLAAPPPVAPTRTRTPRATRSTPSGTTRKPRGTAAVVAAEASRQTLLALTAAPAEGFSRNAIAELLEVEANALTAVIKQLKESGQIDQLGERRGARYVLSEQGRAAVASETEGEA
jgi:predicted HTH transcriptional regulator